jgi:hypothetical protein
LGRGVDDQATCSNWRDWEIRELLTIMGDKSMQLHLKKTFKDGAIDENLAEIFSL